MKRFITRSTIAVGAALIAGLSIGVGYVAFADEPSKSVSTDPDSKVDDIRMPSGQSIDSLTKSWPKNRFGLTVGDISRADQEARNFPDLTHVRMKDGRLGYLRNDEVFPPEPKGEDAFIEQQRARFNDAGEEVKNVYEADGKTKIGTLVVGSVSMEDGEGHQISPKTGRAVDPQ